MFCEADSFNQPLNDWNVSKVKYMEAMFWCATSFNQPLNKWNVSNVKSMYAMFAEAESFNQPLQAHWLTSARARTQYEWDLGNRKVRVDSGYQGLTSRRYWLDCERVRGPHEVLGRFLRGGPPAQLIKLHLLQQFGFRPRPSWSILVCLS